MPSGLQEDGNYFCKPCRLYFASYDGYLSHLKDKNAERDVLHICCVECGILFKTEKARSIHVHEVSASPLASPCPPPPPQPSNAISQLHPTPQNLFCPGCNDGPFLRAAALVAHVEKGYCPKITMDMVNQKREEKSKLARDLQGMVHNPVHGNFYGYIKPSKAKRQLGTAGAEADPASAPHMPDARGIQEISHTVSSGPLQLGRDLQPTCGVEELYDIKDAADGAASGISTSPVSLFKDGLGVIKDGSSVVDWSKFGDSNPSEPKAESVASGDESSAESDSSVEDDLKRVKSRAPSLQDPGAREWVLNIRRTAKVATVSGLMVNDKAREWIRNFAAGINPRAAPRNVAGGDAVTGGAQLDRQEGSLKSSQLNSSAHSSQRVEAKSTSPASVLVPKASVLGLKASVLGLKASVLAPKAPERGEDGWPVGDSLQENKTEPNWPADGTHGRDTQRGSPQDSGRRSESPVGGDGEAGEAGVWSTDPGVVNTRWPTAEEMANNPVPEEPRFDATHPHHPENPSFNVQRYRNGIGRFPCPMPYCL